jgi:hypothetical protein
MRELRTFRGEFRNSELSQESGVRSQEHHTGRAREDVRRNSFWFQRSSHWPKRHLCEGRNFFQVPWKSGVEVVRGRVAECY